MVLGRVRRHVRLAVADGAASATFVNRHRRAAIYRWCGATIGAGSEVSPGVRATDLTKLVMGSGGYLGPDVYFENHELVTLADGVWVAARTSFATVTHEVGPSVQRAGNWRRAPIVVGRGTWIGMACVILPGVTIGEGCIIAAGSVVTQDCEPNGLYAGVPAVRKRDLE